MMDLYIASLWRVAACQERAATLYRCAGQSSKADSATRIATQARLKAERLSK